MIKTSPKILKLKSAATRILLGNQFKYTTNQTRKNKMATRLEIQKAKILGELDLISYIYNDQGKGKEIQKLKSIMLIFAYAQFIDDPRGFNSYPNQG